MQFESLLRSAFSNQSLHSYKKNQSIVNVHTKKLSFIHRHQLHSCYWSK